MIAANQFALNHMNHTNHKIPDLPAHLQTLFRFVPMANCDRATGSATVGRAFELTTLWTFLLVLICVLGSLGCKRSPHGEQNGESSAQRFREGKVIGGSMAPHFRGEHFVAQCNGCGSYFEGDFEQSKMAVSLICPFCGSQNSVTGRRGSDRVSIEVEPESISRWDVVAFQLPNVKQAGIKRVVGSVSYTHLTLPTTPYV